MPHSFGYRARTRHMFKRGFKARAIKLSTYLINYHQKGMPHKYYHGRTGIVYNVTPSAVGVIVYKVVGNRYIEKRVNLRVEHIRHSKCRQEFLDRVKRNAAAEKVESSGARVSLKRIATLPRESRTVSTTDNAPQTIAPVRYETFI
ncbi:translation protein SH3-like domain-containing protein [Mucidula mucida]|nr:translation protein SH3-like domain-containing protein [Mucidula mucida]